MTYLPTAWEDLPSTDTAINASRLNNMEAGIVAVSRFANTWHDVRAYGALGNGVADDTAAIQGALADATGGGTVFLPPGTYKVTSTLAVDGCKLLGPAAMQFTNGAGAVLHITDTSNPAVALKAGGSIDGIGFYYPSQTTGASPTVYPPTVQCQVSSGNAQNRQCEIRNCTFVNSYIAIDTNGSSGSGFAAWIKIVDNRICAISIGVKHPFCLIETFICRNNFTYALWDASQGQAIRTTISANATAIQLGNGSDEVDGTTIAENGIYGFNKAIYFAGNASITTINGNWIDGCCFGIDLSGVSSQTGSVAITGGVIIAVDPNASTRRGFAIGAAWTVTLGSSAISITGVQFNQSAGDQIKFTGSVGTTVSITVTGCRFGPSRYNDTSTASYGVFVGGAAVNGVVLNVTGNQFADEVNQSSSKMVGVSTISGVAVVADNTFRWMNKSVDVSGVPSGGRAVVTGNAAFLTNTQDLVFNTAEGIGRIGLNRWAKGQGGIDESTSGAYTVASAATVTLPDSEDFIIVNGTTNITSVTASWPGRIVTLVFTGALTFTDGSNLKLNGNFVTTADDTITLACIVGNWYEISRSAN